MSADSVVLAISTPVEELPELFLPPCNRPCRWSGSR